MMEIIVGLVSGITGGIVGLVTARKVWFRTTSQRKKDVHDESSRIIDLLREANRIALENARLEYGIELRKAVEEAKRELRAEMEEKFDAMFTVYGCDLAPDCDDHKPRRSRNGF